MPRRFKVPIPSRAWFSRGTVRQAQRFGSIAATLVSNPSGEEPRPPPQAAHIAKSGLLQPWPEVTDSPKWFQLGATWRFLRVTRSHFWVSPLSAAAGIFSTLFSLFNLVVFLGLGLRNCSTPKSTEQTLIPKSKKKWRHFDVRHRQGKVFWRLKFGF